MVEVRLEISNGTTYFGLDLSQDEVIYWSKQFTDITSFDVVGSFTRDFRVPATPTNMALFGDIGIVNYDSGWFDFRTKTDARLFVDGILIADGHIQVRKVYRDASGGGELRTKDIDVVFYSETPNLAKSIGDKKLADIADLSTLNTALEYVSLTDSVAGTLEAGNVIYALIDRGQNFSQLEGSQFQPVYDEGDPLYIGDFTPCVNAKWLWQNIWSDAGFYYSGAALDTELEKYWVPWLSERFVKTTELPEGNLFRLGIDANLVGQTLPITITADFDEEYDNGANVAGGIFTAPFAGTYRFQGWIHIQRTTGTGNDTVNIVLTKDNISVPELFGAGGAFITNNTDTYAIFYDAEAFIESGAEIRFRVSGGSPGHLYTIKSSATYDPNVGTGWQLVSVSDPVQDATVDMVLNAPDMRQTDFVRSIIKLHNLVLIPDETAPNKLTVEFMDTYLGSGDQRDYTQKLDVSKDVQIYPTNEFQKRTISWTYAQDQDYLNELYFKEGKRVYGRILFEDTGNDFAQGEEKIELSFGPTPCAAIPGTNIIIPKFTNDKGEFVNPKPRLLYRAGTYEGVKVYDFDVPGVVDTEVIVLSHYQSVDAEIDTNDLNFGMEVPLHPTNGTPYQTAYNRWWRNYIREIYGGLGADDLFIQPFIMEAYFNLSSMDVYQLKFSDTLWIIDGWWRVLEVTDHAVGRYELTKMKLMKVLDVEAECLWTPYQSGVGGLVIMLNADGVTTGDGTQACCEKYGYVWNTGNSKCYHQNGGGKPKLPNIPQLPGDLGSSTGGTVENLTSVDAAYTVQPVDAVIEADATTAPFTITLPTPASMFKQKLSIAKSDASGNAVSISGTIAGTSPIVLSARGNGAQLYSDGNSWVIISTFSNVTQYTDEMAQDAIGGILGNFFTYNDATPSITIAPPLEWNSGQAGDTVALSTTSYYSAKANTSADNTTEGNRQTIAGKACTITGVAVAIRTTQSGTGSLVFTLRKNGVDTALVLTIAAGSVAAVYTATHAGVTFAANDLISYKVVNNATTASASVQDITTVGFYT